MDIEKARKKIQDNYKKTMAIVDLIEISKLEKLVNQVSGKCIFLKDTDTVKEGLAPWITAMGKYELDVYYVSQGRLAVQYVFGEIEVIVYAPLSEIEVIGNGKCKVVSQTITEDKVVCDLKGGE